MKGRKSFTMIKIDLEKNYDCLNWYFVVDTLHLIGFDLHIIDLINACISTPSMQILQNGKKKATCFFLHVALGKGIPFRLICLFCVWKDSLI